MPLCNSWYRSHLLCNLGSRGNNYKHLPLALRLGILHRRRSPQSRRLLRLKGYIMETHSTGDSNAQRRHKAAWGITDLSGFVICTCATPPSRVCIVPDCGKVLSRHNRHPFCNSCRKNDPELTNLRPGVASMTRPVDYDGIPDHHQCTD